MADRDLGARLPQIELADLRRPIDSALKRPGRREQRADLAQIVIDDRLAPLEPNGAISSRIRCPGIAASSPSSRWISALNGSSFEPAGARRYTGGFSERNARRTVLRSTPNRRASSLIDTPRTKCSRRNSAHRSTSSTPSSPPRSR
jgi:hypothetical protein